MTVTELAYNLLGNLFECHTQNTEQSITRPLFCKGSYALDVVIFLKWVIRLESGHICTKSQSCSLTSGSEHM